MVYRELEMNYLLSLLKAALNNELPPETGKIHDWGFLFKMAEFHGVTVMTYYALLGRNEAVPKEWKDKFSESFRKGVSRFGQQQKELLLLGRILSKSGISMLLLPPAGVACMYPQADMREVKEIYLLAERKEEKKMHRALSEAGFRFEGRDSGGSMAYVTRRNVRFVFIFRIFAHNRRLSKSYKKIWEIAKQDSDLPSLYYLSPDDQYVLLVSWICDKFVFSRPGIRDAADVYVFLRNWKKRLNWTYIDLKLTELEIGDFARELKKLSHIWFDRNSGNQDEDRTFRVLEECMLSKGLHGLEQNAVLIPMIEELKIWKLKEEHRERFRKALRWFFPELNYMKGIYQSLETIPFLLPFCWLLRLGRLLSRSIRIRMKKKYFKLYFRFDRLWTKIGRFIRKQNPTMADGIKEGEEIQDEKIQNEEIQNSDQSLKSETESSSDSLKERSQGADQVESAFKDSNHG